MVEKLQKLLENSYCPYSKFKVAAVVVTKDGKEFAGVNVENASFGATICAERSAIVNDVSNGYRKNDFASLFIMCDDDRVASPCFVCRQVIYEFFSDDATVVCMTRDGKLEKYLVKDLCPYPFGEENLK